MCARVCACARACAHLPAPDTRAVAELGAAKARVEEVRQENATRAMQYKEELALMKELVLNQRAEWEQFGRELTLEHGQAQADRTKARVAESIDEKAKLGRQVRRAERRTEAPNRGRGRRRRGARPSASRVMASPSGSAVRPRSEQGRDADTLNK